MIPAYLLYFLSCSLCFKCTHIWLQFSSKFKLLFVYIVDIIIIIYHLEYRELYFIYNLRNTKPANKELYDVTDCLFFCFGSTAIEFSCFLHKQSRKKVQIQPAIFTSFSILFLKYTMDWLNLKLILEYISRKGIYEN